MKKTSMKPQEFWLCPPKKASALILSKAFAYTYAHKGRSLFLHWHSHTRYLFQRWRHAVATCSSMATVGACPCQHKITRTLMAPFDKRFSTKEVKPSAAACRYVSTE